jgi:thiamine-monophosphate kinase
MKEFELIRKYFSERGPKRKDVVLGIGDDAALMRVPQDKLLVTATDTMVENTHFFPNTSARSIGHRCLAVNLSDFAAMGAEPAWASVAITLPTVDEDWIEEFTQGLFDAAEYCNVQIIGGDTTQGPLAITVSLNGFVPENKALLRSGAKPGDWIYVTGTLGDSALTVASKLNKVQVKAEYLEQAELKFNYPVARLAAGQVIRRVATSAIDISDGLIQDLSHILNASNVSAEIDVASLPISTALTATLDEDSATVMALIGGEDYELLFTISEEQKGYLEQNATSMGVGFTCIGQVRGGDSGISLMKADKKYPLPNMNGYQHFSSEDQ